MNAKVGRNDPCPCGSGKKYKQCCALKKMGKKKLTAKWLNTPVVKMPNLLERTFGEAVSQDNPEPFKPVKSFKITNPQAPEVKEDTNQNENL